MRACTSMRKRPSARVSAALHLDVGRGTYENVRAVGEGGSSHIRARSRSGHSVLEDLERDELFAVVRARADIGQMSGQKQPDVGRARGRMEQDLDVRA